MAHKQGWIFEYNFADIGCKYSFIFTNTILNLVILQFLRFSYSFLGRNFGPCLSYNLLPLNRDLTLKAETFAGRNFRESQKSRNFANLSFANFILWRKFTEKTFANFRKSSFLDVNNFREWLRKVNNNHFKSHFFLQ